MHLEVEIHEEQAFGGMIYLLRLGEGRAQLEVDYAVFNKEPDAVRFALEALCDALRIEAQRVVYTELKALEESEKPE